MKLNSNNYTSRIRIKKNNNTWRKVRIAEIATVILGQSPDSKNYTDNPNDYILVQGNADMRNGRVVPRVWTSQVTKLAEKGDLILSVRAPVGDVGKTDYPVVLGRGVAAIKGNEFLFQLLIKMKQSHYWSKFSTGSTFESINSNDIKSAEIYLPSIEEQSAIGSFFRTLDDLLASYKNNLANYQSLKATMLSKMFPKAGQTVPEIRLDGFEGEWDEWKLSDFSQKVTEKNKDNIYSETFTNSAEFGIINQRDFFDKDISNEKSLNTYYVVRNNDYVYNPRISNFAPVGPIKRNKLGRTGVMSPLYFVFRVTNSNIDLDFLETFFNTNTWHKFMKLNGDSGARADRFAIKDSVFLNMPITIPSLLEQQAIGSYFSNLDQLITSYQEKITQLETLKTKLLQDMFI
ncbi:restriction endonuclease subunit S [Streptococcus sp.]|uniref:restriction endonuclease subunit S n=1 Tax=Streptococcus sp. TaxID=1306 RepID=UPI0025ECB989|nr:restriction endonuclease subunit S [Streptococcus sp.]